MITQAFLVLLLDLLPPRPSPAGEDREAGLTIARTLLEALHPADAKEGPAQAARAIARALRCDGRFRPCREAGHQ